MAGLIATIWAFLSDWHRLEFRRIGNFGVVLVASPLAFIVIGGILGAANWQLKAWVVGIGILLAFVLFLWLAWRRLAIGVEIATALAVTEQGAARGFLGDVRVAAENYVRLIAAILASEITIGLIVIMLPEHVSPVLTLLLILASLALTMWAVWQKTAVNAWATTVQWVAIGTIIVAIVGIVGRMLLPQAMQAVTQHGVGVDESVTAVVRGTPSAPQLFWVIAVLVILAVVVPAVLKKNLAGAIGGGAVFLAIAIFVGYYVRDEEEKHRAEQAARAARPPRMEAAPTPAPPRQQQSAPASRVVPAPATPAPTIVTKVSVGMWLVSINGTNAERAPLPSHRTTVRVKPGEGVVIRHRDGALEFARDGAPVGPCGTSERHKRGPLGGIRASAIALALVTLDQQASVVSWPCGHETVVVTNTAATDAELVLIFNGRVEQGRKTTVRDWQRMRFEVAVRSPAQPREREANAPVKTQFFKEVM